MLSFTLFLCILFGSVIKESTSFYVSKLSSKSWHSTFGPSSYRYGASLLSKSVKTSVKNTSPDSTKPIASTPIVEKRELHRTINILHIPHKKPVLCKIVANEKERDELTIRHEVPDIVYLAANVTLTRVLPHTILVTGDLEARFDDPLNMNEPPLKEQFETTLLNNVDSGVAIVRFEDAPECDDEVPPSGIIDVGEIVAQYLGFMCD